MYPKPGTITAIQVILWIRVALGAFIYLLALVGLGALSDSQIQSEMGMGRGLAALLMLAGVGFTIFEAYVAATMGRGGGRTQTLVRVVVGIGFASLALNLLWGDFNFIGLIIIIVILVLNEGEAARSWYEETEAPASYRGRY